MTFTPVTLAKDGQTRLAQSAVEETNLRFEGWRSAPKDASAEQPEQTETPAPRPRAPKP
jgi:hypothetical protein